VLLIEGLSLTVFSKHSASVFSNKYSRAYSFTSDPAESIQVAGIGNSDLYSGFVPATLWKDYGYTSTVIATPRQTLPQSYNLLEELLKCQSPKLLVLEVDMLYDNPPNKSNAMESERNLDILFDYLNTDNFENTIKKNFSIFTFHDRWKKIGKSKSAKKVKTGAHGYYYSDLTSRLKKKDYMVQTDDVEHIKQMNKDYVTKMIKACNDKGTDVLLVELPSPSSWNYERHNAVQELADENNVEFLDLNLCLDEMNFTMKNSFRDKGNHLNYNGASTVTEYIGAYIKDNYSIDDRRQDSQYAYWNEDCDEFFKQINA
jgi:hypothetical protein